MQRKRKYPFINSTTEITDYHTHSPKPILKIYIFIYFVNFSCILKGLRYIHHSYSCQQNNYLSEKYLDEFEGSDVSAVLKVVI